MAAELVVAASNSAADEILVIGHSLGAVLAVDLLDRALKRDPTLDRKKNSRDILERWIIHTQDRPAPKGSALSQAMERVANSRAIFWGDYQALTDPLNFYKSRPMAEMGLSTENEATVRVVKLVECLTTTCIDASASISSACTASSSVEMISEHRMTTSCSHADLFQPNPRRSPRMAPCR